MASGAHTEAARVEGQRLRAEQELSKALRGGDAELIEEACRRAESCGVAAPSSIGAARAEASRLRAQKELPATALLISCPGLREDASEFPRASEDDLAVTADLDQMRQFLQSREARIFAGTVHDATLRTGACKKKIRRFFAEPADVFIMAFFG